MPIDPFLTPRLIGANFGLPAVGDFDNDGLYEPFGLLNNGDGTFSGAPYELFLAPYLGNYPGRVNRDNRAVDLNGDGNLDVIWNVYSDPSIEDSFTLIFYGDGNGGFGPPVERQDVNGFGETIVAADFDNDGDTDIFLPVYTHVAGSDSQYLLFNDGGVLGSNLAVEWGLELYLPVIYRVEGAQAADINFDGRIDLFVGSHLFVNEGDRFTSQPLDPYFFDEGANFIDYDNDGDFDLILRPPNAAPHLFEWDGASFNDTGAMTGDVSVGFGVKVFDVDANGWMDVVFSTETGIAVLFNESGTFTRVDMPLDFVPDTFAFFDYDNDGRAELLVRQPPGKLYLMENNLPTGETLFLNVVGPNGELNQHGRSLILTPQGSPEIHMARAVESGSGYMGQDQYELMIGLPLAGAYDVQIFFASGPLEFVAGAGQTVTAFADGRVAIDGTTGDDVFGGGAGSDSLVGGEGDDRVVGSRGSDNVDGGGGEDAIDFSGAEAGVRVDLSLGSAEVAGDTQTLAAIENVVGSDHADEIVGDGGANVLAGGAGIDFLDGRGGADELRGGLGNDVYIVDNSGDTVIELVNEGNDVAYTSVSYSLIAGSHVETLSVSDHALTTAINLIGNEFANNVYGNSGANILDGGGGADVMVGFGGNDVYGVDNAGDQVIENAGEGTDRIATTVSYTLAAGSHVETLSARDHATTTALVLTGNELANNVYGNIGANILDGGGGADVMIGFGGNDVYGVDNAGDQVIESAGGGTDRIATSVGYTLAAGSQVETLSVTDHSLTTAIDLTGNEIANNVYGNSGANVLDGGGGADVMIGFGGNDVYVVDNAGDQVIESSGGGTDEVRTALSIYALGANLENLTGTSGAGQELVGNASGNVLAGGSGADVLRGGLGNDIYIVEAQDTVVEAASEGTDEVRTALSVYTLGTNVEILTGTSNLGQELIGNGLGNVISGGLGVDQMRGGLGDDIYIVSTGDIVTEVATEGTDEVRTALSTYTLAANVEALTGTSNLGQELIGNELGNVISGGLGADQMRGGLGDDLYIVGTGDVVTEAGSEGTDEVRTALSVYTLGANVENLTGTSGQGQKLIGNSLGNVIKSSASLSTLIGGAGDDIYYVFDSLNFIQEDAGQGFDRVRAATNYELRFGLHVEVLETVDPASLTDIALIGNEFANSVYGNNGANLLIGGAAADIMIGFGGNDVYGVDNAGDQVIESSGGGTDAVYASVSYTLAAGGHVETLSVADHSLTTAINLTGNEIGNNVYGNIGANILDGGGGADVMIGFGGNDVFVVDNAGDQVIENAGGGTDRIVTTVSYALAAGSHVETLSARDHATTTALVLTGNEIGNNVLGNNGANTLDGGGGVDWLYGFGGADTFAFTAAPGAGNADVIADFSAVDDTIALENAVFTGLAAGALDANAFVVGSAAGDADDRIIYIQATGQLFFDADGSGAGAALLFAVLQGTPSITASDFTVI